MYFKELFNENMTINWDIVENIPEFSRLKDTPHSLKWHKEGGVIEHTKLVVNEMMQYLKEIGISSNDRTYFILICASLCHDLGKATTTKWDKEKNDYVCRNHGEEGSKIVRNLFFEDEIYLREEICWLVRWHMTLHHILEKDEFITRNLIKLTCGVFPDGIQKLWILTLCDSLGSINDESRDFVINKFNKIKQKAIELNCFDIPYKFENPCSKIQFFLDKNEKYPNKVDKFYDGRDFTVYMMIGIPGSGKDTFINNFNSSIDFPIEVICRDDIRTEIGIIGEKPNGTKEQEDMVTDIFNERLLKRCQSRQSVFINNTNVKKKYREEFLKMILPYQPKILYIYVESPTLEDCKKRREGQMPLNVIDRMWKNLEFPDITECDNLVLMKQYSD